MRIIRSNQTWRIVDNPSGDKGSLESLAFQAGYRVREVCVALGCSSRYLHALFVRDIGLAPGHWLQLERLAVARRKLQQGKEISEVIKELRFTSLSAFRRNFEKLYHYDPETWANNLVVSQLKEADVTSTEISRGRSSSRRLGTLLHTIPEKKPAKSSKSPYCKDSCDEKYVKRKNFEPSRLQDFLGITSSQFSILSQDEKLLSEISDAIEIALKWCGGDEDRLHKWLARPSSDFPRIQGSIPSPLKLILSGNPLIVTSKVQNLLTGHPA